MKWISLLAVLLLCTSVLHARAGNLSKCSGEGGAIAYRGHACLPGERLVATLAPAPEATAPRTEGESTRTRPARHSASSRGTVRLRSSRVPRSRSRTPRKPRATRHDPCATAKKARDDFQRRRGIRITMDELSRWNHRVYDACK